MFATFNEKLNCRLFIELQTNSFTLFLRKLQHESLMNPNENYQCFARVSEGEPKANLWILSIIGQCNCVVNVSKRESNCL